MAATTTPWGDASAILAAAGIEEDTSYYREFTGEDEKAVLTVAMRIQEGWERNDADYFADTFADNGSLLMKDDQLTSREQIREYMKAGFEAQFRGARVRGWPLSVKFLGDDTAMVISQGGILLAGETETAPERQVRVTWVIVKESGGLKLLSHQTSPIKG
ncbi:SgcJ/EcaC family oxidoreductase [Amycolatopsis sp. NPDC059027]|uniref:SgcJ/EcaC family oxidoreductase n=1 Tax=Amycolatopsis sp. NPDC059027 TaxID=3346709 RepID=UPI00366F1A04